MRSPPDGRGRALPSRRARGREPSAERARSATARAPAEEPLGGRLGVKAPELGAFAAAALSIDDYAWERSSPACSSLQLLLDQLLALRQEAEVWAASRSRVRSER